jgi:hypothetical protein
VVAVLGLALGGAWISELGDRPDRDGLSAEPSATGPAPAVSPDPTDGAGGEPDGEEPDGADAQSVALGARVPAAGVITLEPGAVHRYRLELAADQEVYLEEMVENCAHQLPWTLTDGEGVTVANGRMFCGTFGPVSLAAGRYELRIGGDNVDGRYAFQLTGR